MLATSGSAGFLNTLGIAAEPVPKVGQGHPDVVERIESGDVDLVTNTVGSEATAIRDSASIRRSTLLRGIPYCTTLAGARQIVSAQFAHQLEASQRHVAQHVMHVRCNADDGGGAASRLEAVS